MNRLLGIIAIVGIGALVYSQYKEAKAKEKLKVKK